MKSKNTKSFPQISNRLVSGVDMGIFPAAEFLIAKDGEVVFHESVGSVPKATHHFDLASLTKALCTALVCMRLFDQNKLDPENLISNHLQTVHKNITIKQLLNHTSGFVDWHGFYNDIPISSWQNYNNNRDVILDRILNDASLMRNEHAVLYSDLGYILLGHLLENLTRTKLDDLFRDLVTKPLKLVDKIFFVRNNTAPADSIKHFLPTEICPIRHTVTKGSVMDQNCHVLGGVTGHAGLFGNAHAIHSLLQELRRARTNQSHLFSQRAFNTFCTPDPERQRKNFLFTLGFDTPTNGISQAGQRFSSNTIGHLGYSGTSFWWDLDQDVWMILLTNRCMPDRHNHKIREFRPQLHNLAFAELTMSSPSP